MRILMIGDVMGRPGRLVVKYLLPGLRDVNSINLVIANGENAAGGRGLTAQTADELFESGVDVITSGNHIWQQKEIIQHLNDTSSRILRPENYAPDVPGRGYLMIGQVLVINLIGRVFMGAYECPFRTFDRIIGSLPQKPLITIVDIHAEATSEKSALGWYVDGRASAVLGTHTHVATADTRIFPKGTAFVTDVGMTGPSRSVIGNDVQTMVNRFLYQMPTRFPVAEGPVIFNSVLIDIDDKTGKAISIRRLDEELDLG